jgi:hypothetical protein
MVSQSEYLDMSSEQPRAAPSIEIARQAKLLPFRPGSVVEIGGGLVPG